MRALFSGFIKKSKNVESVKCNLDDLYNILKKMNYLCDDEIKDYENYKNRNFKKPEDITINSSKPTNGNESINDETEKIRSSYKLLYEEIENHKK